jgi:hypothetical protein
MTLVEFLTAMLDRDEAPTWTLSPYACEPGCCAPAGWVGSQCRYCDPSPVYGGTVEAITSSAEEHAETIHQRSRVLRDVEAKRRIVEFYRYEIDPEYCRYLPPDMEKPPAAMALRLLALPDADHEDYREEWKP